MKLTNILKEINDENDSQSVRAKHNITLVIQSTPIPEVEKALEDLDNYGKYASYAQNTNIDIPQAKSKFFGPKGGPNVKVATAKKDWNSADSEWRLLKSKDIKSRLPQLDTTGWEDLSFDELPKEARDWKNFYPQLTKDALDNLIKNMSTTSNILDWYVDKNSLVFPRKSNENIPGDNTMEKILKTVMDNAGITDYKIGKKEEETDGEPTVLKKVSKFTQLKVTVPSRADASELRAELKEKFVIPTAVYEIAENGEEFDLIIKNITISQKAKMQMYLQDEGLMEGIDFDKRRMLVLAGIIK